MNEDSNSVCPVLLLYTDLIHVFWLARNSALSAMFPDVMDVQRLHDMEYAEVLRGTDLAETGIGSEGRPARWIRDLRGDLQCRFPWHGCLLFTGIYVYERWLDLRSGFG